MHAEQAYGRQGAACRGGPRPLEQGQQGRDDDRHRHGGDQPGTLLARVAQGQQRQPALAHEQRSQQQGGQWHQQQPGQHRLARIGQQRGQEGAEQEHVALGEIEDMTGAIDDVHAHGHQGEDRTRADSANGDDCQFFHAVCLFLSVHAGPSRADRGV
ncbi:hypothetical protein D3C72_1748960 [compost metagenome]